MRKWTVENKTAPKPVRVRTLDTGRGELVGGVDKSLLAMAEETWRPRGAKRRYFSPNDVW